MIILYKVKHISPYGYSQEVKCCGDFRSLDHFLGPFKQVESYRGWEIVTYTILRG